MGARSGARRGAVAAAVVAAALSVGGCAGEAGGDAGSVERDEFIAVVVQLRELERRVVGSDSAMDSFEREKAEVLEEHGVTEEELRAFVRLHGGDVELMRTLWDSIDSRLTRTPADSAAAPGDSAPVRRRFRVEDDAADSAISSGASPLRTRRAPAPPPDSAPAGS